MRDIISLRNPHCRDCMLFENCETVCLFGEGKSNASIVFVGEAPGDNEDRMGRPFVSKAGTLLENLLSTYNIPRDSVYLTNAIKCKTKDGYKPKADEIRACRQYLIEEIKSIQPKLIVALGEIAMRSLMDTNSFRIGVNRGIFHKSPIQEISDIPILLTYHPAGILRNQVWINPALLDFEKIKNFLDGNIPKVKKANYYKGVSDASKVKSIIVDLETDGFNPFKPDKDILCIGTSVASYEGYCTSQIDSNDIRRILSDPKIIKVGHNLKFDLKWLLSHGFVVHGPIRDTMIEAHLLDENRPSFGLKELAAMYTDMGAYAAKMERCLKLVKGSMKDVPVNVREKYCAMDVDATKRLDTMFVPQLKEQGLVPVFKLTMKGERLFTDAEVSGVQIDIGQRDLLKKQYKKRLTRIHEKLCEIARDDEFNPNSSPQLVHLLVTTLHLPVLKYTRKKKISMDRDVLDKLLPLDKSGTVKLILKLRELQGDYAKYLREDITEADGRVHCDFRVNGTKTGRYSCSSPNLQAATKDSPVKSMFISRFTGGYIVNTDYDQGELRLLAEYSRDEVLLSAFKEQLDIHRVTASQVFGGKPEDITDEQRFAAKTINFGIIYGMGPDKLSRTINVPIPKAAKYIRDYKSRLKRVNEWIKDREVEIVETGYVTSLFGRRRRLPLVDLEDKKAVFRVQRQAVNSPIQGALHDLNILSAVELDRQMKKQGMRGQIILAVHDSIVADIPDKEELREYIRLTKEIFPNPDTSAFGFEFQVPLTVSIGYGRNWKEASEKK